MKYLTEEEHKQLNLYFDAANYLAVGQLYLLDNPLLKRKLEYKDIKPRLVGHWGTIPGQNFLFMHLNRVITKYNLNMIYLVGPGHGGQTAVTNAYLDGTYTVDINVEFVEWDFNVAMVVDLLINNKKVSSYLI